MYTLKRTLIAAALTTALTPGIALSFENDATTIETDLEVIVVSGSRTEKALKDVAGSISVITEEDIEKQVVTDMSQLFKYDPSIEITGVTGDAQNFIVRGMGGDRVLMIKDGMRMNEGYGANGLNDIVGRGFIETDTLKQVEVAKGAASSLYGSDALGGIVVFTTKNASDYLDDDEKFAGQLKLNHNTDNDQNSVGATFALKTGDLEHVFHSTARSGQESQNYDETKPSLDIQSTSFFYKSHYQLNETDFIAGSADIWQQEVKGDYAYGLLEYFRGLNGYDILSESNTSDKESQAFQLQYHSETSTRFYDLLNVSIYSNESTQKDVEQGQLDIDANFGYPIVEIRDMWKTSRYEQKTIGLLSNASLTLNDTHTIGYGLDIENSESLRTEHKLYEVEGTPKQGYPQETEKFPTTDVKRAGIFFNDEISLLNSTLTITPGIRFDTYEMTPQNTIKEDGSAYKSFDESHTSLNIGGLYKLSDNVALFAQYGQGFKVPAYDLAYIYHDNSLYGYKIVPSDDLSPEESDTFELGIRGQINDFTFNSAIYHSKYDNFLATHLVGVENVVNRYTGQETPVNIFQYQNIEAVTIKGVEVAMNYAANNYLSVFANATYQDGTNDETGDYLTSISPFSGNLGVSLDYQDLSTEILFNWAKRMDKVNDGNTEIAGYGTIDLLANYAFNDDLQINVAVTNLTDKKYIRYINGAGHGENSALDNVTESGRSLSASIRYNF